MRCSELDIVVKIMQQASVLGRRLSKLGLLAAFVKIMQEATYQELRTVLGKDYDEVLREALRHGIVSVRGTRVRLTWIGELFLASLSSLLESLTFVERYYT